MSLPRMKSRLLLAVLVIASAATVTATVLFNESQPQDHEHALAKRERYFQDGFKIFVRLRNAHACLMSCAFIVLLPLGAISLHLPLRGTPVVTRIHVPIQITGWALVVAGLGIGVRMANNDLNFFGAGAAVKAHVVVGLTAAISVILLQPILGIIQHINFKRTGKKSILSYAHRWIGRVAIVLGWINTGLGFQLVPISLVSTSSLVKEYTLLGIFAILWFSLVAWDGYRSHFAKRERLPAYRLMWKNGVILRGPEGATGQDLKESVNLMPVNRSRGVEGEGRTGERFESSA